MPPHFCFALESPPGSHRLPGLGASLLPFYATDRPRRSRLFPLQLRTHPSCFEIQPSRQKCTPSSLSKRRLVGFYTALIVWRRFAVPIGVTRPVTMDARLPSDPASSATPTLLSGAAATGQTPCPGQREGWINVTTRRVDRVGERFNPPPLPPLQPQLCPTSLSSSEKGHFKVMNAATACHPAAAAIHTAVR